MSPIRTSSTVEQAAVNQTETAKYLTVRALRSSQTAVLTAKAGHNYSSYKTSQAVPRIRRSGFAFD